MSKTIAREELKKLLDSSDKTVKILDVLSEDHFARGHIKGAISLPFGKIDKYAHRILDPNDKIIVYCANTQCQASPAAAEKLMAMGFGNVYDYAEGLHGYKEAGFPVEEGFDAAARGVR